MAEPLKICSDNTRDKEGGKILDHKFKTLCLEPASPALVAELESRLGVMLPEEYKEFLSISSDFNSSWTCIQMDPPLFSTKDAWRVDEDEDYFTDRSLSLLDERISNSFLPQFLSQYNLRPQLDKHEWPTVGRAIVMATVYSAEAINHEAERIDHVCLFLPDKVKEVRDLYLQFYHGDNTPGWEKNAIHDAIFSFAGSMKNFTKLEWSVCKFDDRKEVCFPSFKAFIAETARASSKERDKNKDDGNRNR